MSQLCLAWLNYLIGELIVNSCKKNILQLAGKPFYYVKSGAIGPI